MQPPTEAAIATKIKSYISAYAASMPPTNIDGSFIRKAVLTSVSPETPTSNAKTTHTLTIPPLVSNSLQTGNMHGGAVATFFDNATSMAVFACTHAWEGTSGVTRNLNVTYFRPAREGEVVEIESEVLQLTKRLATIRGVMRRVEDGMVVAVCQHDKYRSSLGPGGRARI